MTDCKVHWPAFAPSHADASLALHKQGAQTTGRLSCWPKLLFDYAHALANWQPESESRTVSRQATSWQLQHSLCELRAPLLTLGRAASGCSCMRDSLQPCLFKAHLCILLRGRRGKVAGVLITSQRLVGLCSANRSLLAFASRSAAFVRLQTQVGRLEGWHSRPCAHHQQCCSCAACAHGMLTAQHMPMQEPEVLDNIRVLEVPRKTKPVKRPKQPAGQRAVKSQVCHDCWMHRFLFTAVFIASFIPWAAAATCTSWTRRPGRHSSYGGREREKAHACLPTHSPAPRS